MNLFLTTYFCYQANICFNKSIQMKIISIYIFNSNNVIGFKSYINLNILITFNSYKGCSYLSKKNVMGDLKTLLNDQKIS